MHLNAGVVKHLTERHRDQLHMRKQACALFRRQRGEKAILAGVMRGGISELPTISHNRAASPTWLIRMLEVSRL